MVAMTLRGAGHEVMMACDGLTALELAKQSWDLALADVNMPNMDGITLIRELRARPEGRFMPILMLTTETSVERKRAGREAGATGWVVKPFDPDQLVATIERVIGLAP
ncbi:CheY-like receiver protein [Nitrococcus mobilis Nb-231]|uniref:CheY-like receiver protein n=2 Tax=Nitrococcus mobilis TaxID=35797 RepID=A4BMS7_9GAMM|nr:CheY-like receiver protein [Nitrococcus mobilis Nb-231]